MGRALGGIAGFFAGVRFPLGGAGRRQETALAVSVSSAPPPSERVGTVQDGESALARRVVELEQRVASLEQRAGIGPVPAAVQEPPTIAVPVVAMPVQGFADAAAAATDGSVERKGGESEVGSRDFETAATPPLPPVQATAAMPAPAAPLRAKRWWAWLAGGNALTRIGVVILFFGVAFLLRYFTERFTMPIEARLAMVAAGGFALAALGVRLAASRPGYGLSLQGAGAGVLYLTTYAAFRPYGVLPEALAVTLLIAVSALTVWLAVRNDSQPLAGLAIAGGFLAPVLVGNDGGPVPLFGYFALLNAAIFTLAWRRAWRVLKCLGFVFTFALGLFWGHGYYRPEHFAVVQPFLALFFVFYVAIAILYARRGPPAARVRSTACSCSAFRSPGSQRRSRSCATSGTARRGARSRWRLSTRALRRVAPSPRAGVRAAVARVPRAGGDLRHAGGTVRVRRSLDGRALGGRGGGRLLDRDPAARRSPGPSHWSSSSAPASRSPCRAVAKPTARCSSTRFSSARC